MKTIYQVYLVYSGEGDTFRAMKTGWHDHPEDAWQEAVDMGMPRFKRMRSRQISVLHIDDYSYMEQYSTPK